MTSVYLLQSHPLCAGSSVPVMSTHAMATTTRPSASRSVVAWQRLPILVLLTSCDSPLNRSNTRPPACIRGGVLPGLPRDRLRACRGWFGSRAACKNILACGLHGRRFVARYRSRNIYPFTASLCATASRHEVYIVDRSPINPESGWIRRMHMSVHCFKKFSGCGSNSRSRQSR